MGSSKFTRMTMPTPNVLPLLSVLPARVLMAGIVMLPGLRVPKRAVVVAGTPSALMAVAVSVYEGEWHRRAAAAEEHWSEEICPLLVSPTERSSLPERTEPLRAETVMGVTGLTACAPFAGW